jgi:hypothetical protein
VTKKKLEIVVYRVLFTSKIRGGDAMEINTSCIQDKGKHYAYTLDYLIHRESKILPEFKQDDYFSLEKAYDLYKSYEDEFRVTIAAILLTGVIGDVGDGRIFFGGVHCGWNGKRAYEFSSAAIDGLLKIATVSQDIDGSLMQECLGLALKIACQQQISGTFKWLSSTFIYPPLECVSFASKKKLLIINTVNAIIHFLKDMLDKIRTGGRFYDEMLLDAASVLNNERVGVVWHQFGCLADGYIGYDIKDLSAVTEYLVMHGLRNKFWSREAIEAMIELNILANKNMDTMDKVFEKVEGFTSDVFVMETKEIRQEMISWYKGKYSEFIARGLKACSEKEGKSS